ncbi:MAG: hypothetical protein RL681_104 [Candidatus Parcubacteria bacterium]|jgi:D-glycero-alpha-D-manno-heptose-7-phosphate kinase
MIVVRAPLRLEFLGGSTDIASFYRRSPGHILNSTIDKYIYVVVKPAPGRGIMFLHEKTERVSHRDQLEHARAKAVLRHFGVTDGLEIVSLSDVPYGGSGLGSSSSFVVALIHAIAILFRERATPRAIAELAAHIEIEALKEPIGKQDQYASAFGGLNHTIYRRNGFVDVKRVRLTARNQRALQEHILVFHTGAGHSASAILGAQAKRDKENFPYLKQMAALAEPAAAALMRGDVERFAGYLTEEWMIKRNLSAGIATPELLRMHAAAIRAGAWGGRVSGAGGGGFLYVLAPRSRHTAVRKALARYGEFPVRFTEKGSEVVADLR